MKQRLLVLAVFLFIIIGPFAVVYVIQVNSTTYMLSDGMKLPIPRGSRNVSMEGLGIKRFQTKKSAEEVRKFYAEYLDSLTVVYRKQVPQCKGYYDKDQNLVITEYSVSESDGKTFFTIGYDPFDTFYWSLE